jgi:hypothetical protein
LCWSILQCKKTLGKPRQCPIEYSSISYTPTTSNLYIYDWNIDSYWLIIRARPDSRIVFPWRFPYGFLSRFLCRVKGFLVSHVMVHPLRTLPIVESLLHAQLQYGLPNILSALFCFYFYLLCSASTVYVFCSKVLCDFSSNAVRVIFGFSFNPQYIFSSNCCVHYRRILYASAGSVYAH